MAKKIAIGINTLTNIEQPVYSNHLQYFFRLGRNTDHQFAINTPRRMSIDRMRNMTAKIALEGEFDYVLFIDDDVVVPVNSLEMLIETKAQIAAGWTIIRGHPFQNMFFKFEDESRQVLKHWQNPQKSSDGLFDCDAVGFSYCLISCDLIRSMNPPYFVTGTHNTEDVYFCLNAKHLFGDQVRIVVHPEIKTYHNIGPELVGIDNRDQYKKYIEDAWPELRCDEPPVDRGDEYLEMVKNAIEPGLRDQQNSRLY